MKIVVYSRTFQTFRAMQRTDSLGLSFLCYCSTLKADLFKDLIVYGPNRFPSLLPDVMVNDKKRDFLKNNRLLSA